MKDYQHYELAFREYLQTRQVPYVSVDEARKAVFRDAQLKSFDFIVYSSRDVNWLVEVKGRRWAARKPGGKPSWQNWVTRDDLDGLEQWEGVFGQGFAALLVFAYWIDAEVEPPAELVFPFRDRRYIFTVVPVRDYIQQARVRSPKWGTVNLPTAEFARFVRPAADWF